MIWQLFHRLCDQSMLSLTWIDTSSIYPVGRFSRERISLGRQFCCSAVPFQFWAKKHPEILLSPTDILVHTSVYRNMSDNGPIDEALLELEATGSCTALAYYHMKVLQPPVEILHSLRTHVGESTGSQSILNTEMDSAVLLNISWLVFSATCYIGVHSEYRVCSERQWKKNVVPAALPLLHNTSFCNIQMFDK